MSIELRPYQQQGLASLEQFIEGGGRRALLAWSTGLGKTILFAHWIMRRGGRALVIAHRDELIQQAAQKIALVDEHAAIGIVKAEVNEPDMPIVVASIQTLARSPERLAQVLAGGLDTVVIDEAHHSMAESYQRVMKMLACATLAPILGVTATPSRGDHKALGASWQKIVHTVSILEGIQQGYLCDLKAERVRLDVDLSKVKLSKYAGYQDYDQGELEHVMLDCEAPVRIAEAVHSRAKGRKTLVFTPGVQTAYDTASALRALGWKAAAVHGEVSQQDRRHLLHKFSCGELDAICNCNVLTEGFDEPGIECVVLARPTRSQPFYVQMVGRGTRTHPGKTDCLVLDCVDAAFTHELVTMPDVFALEAGQAFADRLAAGKSIHEALALVDKGELKIEAVPVMRQAFAWVKAGPAWVLGLGGGVWLQLIEIQNQWQVEEAGQGGVKAVLWKGPSLEYAQGIAEDTMRKRGAEKLVDLTAGWRKAPMSDGQRVALERWGVPYNKTMRRGEASDLLMRLIAGKAAKLRVNV
jgi:ATP-dependent helicase IRC3